MSRRRVLTTALAAVSITFVIATPASADEGESEPVATEPTSTEPSEPEPTTTTDAPTTSAPTGSVPDETDTDESQPDDSSSDEPDQANTDGTTPTSVAEDESERGVTTSTSVPPVASVSESESDVEITSIQVSVADTGNNTSTTSGVAAPGVAATSTQLTTGTATAVGSSDSTQLVQQAVTQLSGDASAEIVQISITFNIGAAIANSGANTIAAGSGSSGGSISTGSATAIGNDSATYATQGAEADADDGESESSQQSTMVLHLGVAVSNTGANTIVATISSPGGASVDTGNATAIGNQSSTNVQQVAAAVGSGDGELTIEQRATIINLGLALADSGSNAIGGALSTAIASGQSADFESLLALILPELLSAAAPTGSAAEPDSAPSGSAATGDASAIGNRSTTAVQQVAVAAANGGTVFIGQDIVVVNAGVASATTGHNSIGSGQASLDPDSQAVVSQLAAFLSGLLAEIEAWSNGEDVELDSDTFEATLGGLSIGLDSSLAANVTGPDPVSGTQATIRQLTAVINLAFALANTGDNTVTDTMVLTTAGGTPSTNLTAATTAMGDSAESAVAEAIGGSTVIIITGDATATNKSLVVVCQLGAGIDMPCLGPDTGSEPPADPVDPVDPADPVDPGQPGRPGPRPIDGVPSQPVEGIVTVDPQPSRQPTDTSGGVLAATGSEPDLIVQLAGLSVLAGAFLVLATRRRPQRV